MLLPSSGPIRAKNRWHCIGPVDKTRSARLLVLITAEVPASIVHNAPMLTPHPPANQKVVGARAKPIRPWAQIAPSGLPVVLAAFGAPDTPTQNRRGNTMRETFLLRLVEAQINRLRKLSRLPRFQSAQYIASFRICAVSFCCCFSVNSRALPWPRRISSRSSRVAALAVDMDLKKFL